MADELDQLLRERFDLSRDDLLAALKALPAPRPWATTLPDEQARLLDEVGFTEDTDASRSTGHAVNARSIPGADFGKADHTGRNEGVLHELFAGPR